MFFNVGGRVRRRLSAPVVGYTIGGDRRVVQCVNTGRYLWAGLLGVFSVLKGAEKARM